MSGMVSKLVTSRSISRSALLTSLLAAASACPGSRQVEPARGATLILVNGDIHTMDPARERATALAINGDKIVAVGDDAEVKQHATATTRIVDLAGKTVTPGLIDA